MNSTQPEQSGPTERSKAEENKFALEMIFVAVIAIAVVAAFVEALTYDLVSSRTPFVIMVPLLLLLGLHIYKLLRSTKGLKLGSKLAGALGGEFPALQKSIGFLIWMVVLLAIIVIAGHYVGIALFMFYLIRILSRESLGMGLFLSLLTTLLIFGLFEYVFNIELYRGLGFRYLMGYQDF